MLGRGVHPTAETFAYLKPYLEAADLALANLESPLTTATVESTSGYVLCAPPTNVQYLADAGLDLLSLSNNHHLDCGEQGLEETQSTLKEAVLGFLGPDSKPIYRTLHDLPLAFLAFDATGEFDLEAATRAVRAAHETGALVVVSLHWGSEYQSGTSEYQQQIAEQLSTAGASLIWGHHPHVLQPAAHVNDGHTLVLYSLGNALFDQYNLQSTRQSALVLVTLNRTGVEALQAIPFVIDVVNSQLVKPDQAAAKTVLDFFNK